MKRFATVCFPALAMVLAMSLAACGSQPVTDIVMHTVVTQAELAVTVARRQQAIAAVMQCNHVHACRVEAQRGAAIQARLVVKKYLAAAVTIEALHAVSG